MNMKRIVFLLIALLTIGILVACDAASAAETVTATTTIVTESGAESVTESGTESGTATTVVDTDVSATDVASDEDAEDIVRPDGWRDETHSKSAEPNYDVVFPDDEVNRIDITISAENWQLMMDDMTELYGEQGTGVGVGPGAGGPPNGAPPDGGGSPDGGRPEGGQPGGFGGDFAPGLDDGDENPIWVESTVVFEDDVWTNVGIRFKGNSSLRSSWTSGDLKLPIKLDFDEFEDTYPEIDNQRFYGFKQLTLSSNYNDASSLRETVASDLFDEMGVVSAETAFYELYLDYGEGPVYVGLYTMVEVVDDTVIETNFDDDDGNVYKPDGVSAAFSADSFDATTLDKETNSDEADFSDVQALYDTLHSELRTTNATAWRSQLESIFDVDTFARWLAVNTVIQNWDTYGVAYHNYYIYTDPSTGLITWIPWDNNEALTSNVRRGVVELDLSTVTDAWPLISYVMADDVYYELYTGYVAEFVEKVDSAELEAEIRAMAEMIRPSVEAEQATGFDTAVQELVDHIYNRWATAETFVAE
jgi:hypothetical protein